MVVEAEFFNGFQVLIFCSVTICWKNGAVYRGNSTATLISSENERKLESINSSIGM